MAMHPIVRVRRRVLAEILVAGGKPEPWQWRHAGLEPDGKHDAPAAPSLGAADLDGPPAAASPDGSAPREKARKRARYPSF